MDDAVAEARGEALLPRHLLQGESHSTPHKTIHKLTGQMQLTRPTVPQVRFDGSRVSQLPPRKEDCEKIAVWNITATSTCTKLQVSVSLKYIQKCSNLSGNLLI